MDDFVMSNLHESRNEWAARLISILTPLIVEGINSIFYEAWKQCLETDEPNKYLMTFQNYLCRVPKWNSIIVETERKRIIERSGCNYLEDLITCVHIIQLKVLTCIRVGNRQKKIDISTPNLDTFLHKAYIHVARKVYTNVYLFEKNISPLLTQKNGRELDFIVQECILTTIRESIPTESIIRAYIDESEEQEEEIIIETIPNVPEPVVEQQEDDKKEVLPATTTTVTDVVPSIKNIDEEKIVTQLTFNDIDSLLDETGLVEEREAPKTIERLEEISVARALNKKMLEEEEDDSEKPNERIKIHTEPMDISGLEFLDLEGSDDNIKLEFEELE